MVTLALTSMSSNPVLTTSMAVSNATATPVSPVMANHALTLMNALRVQILVPKTQAVSIMSAPFHVLAMRVSLKRMEVKIFSKDISAKLF